jgi:hypothetical protein
MPKRKNKDQPGSWHHVMNRGIAHRTVFESPEDICFFFPRLEKTVCQKEIEIHAYTTLSNHFHMPVRSVTGEMSHSMMLIQNHRINMSGGSTPGAGETAHCSVADTNVATSKPILTGCRLSGT